MKTFLREKLFKKANEKNKILEKIHDDFQHSVQLQIQENIEETMQEKLEESLESLNEGENNLKESSRKLFEELNLLKEADGGSDVVVTGVQSKTGLVNDPAENLLNECNEAIDEYGEDFEDHRYNSSERELGYARLRKSRGGRSRGRPFRGGRLRYGLSRQGTYDSNYFRGRPSNRAGFDSSIYRGGQRERRAYDAYVPRSKPYGETHRRNNSGRDYS